QRQAEAQTSLGAGRTVFGLPEAVEDNRQEPGRDPDARVADDDLDVRVHALEVNLHAPALRRELDGVHQQVPHDLLQAIGVAGGRPGARVEHGLQPNVLRVRGRADRI